MCFECIFNYVLLPLGGAYAFYYFAWDQCIKPMRDIHKKIQGDREGMIIWRDRAIAEVENAVEATKKDNDRFQEVVTTQLNESVNRMQATITKWKDPGQKIRDESEADRRQLHRKVDDHMKQVVTRIDTMRNEVDYMKLHKQDMP